MYCLARLSIIGLAFSRIYTTWMMEHSKHCNEMFGWHTAGGRGGVPQGVGAGPGHVVARRKRYNFSICSPHTLGR